MKKLLTFFLTALLTFTVSWAGVETITFSTQGYTNGAAIETVNGTNFTLSFDKGTNSNAPKYYTSGSAIRVYGGNTMTVTSAKTITEIVITFGTGDGSNTISTNVGSYNNGTWTGSTSSVTFTVGGSSGNRRFAAVTVTYEDGITQPNVYKKVTRASELVSGQSYIFVYENGSSSVGMGALNSTPDYGAAVTGLSVSDGKVDIGGTNVKEMTLSGNTGAWVFNTGDYYLAHTTTSNVGFSKGSNPSLNASKWKVTPSTEATAIQNNNTNYYVRYRDGYGFGLYNTNSSNLPVTIYIKYAGSAVSTPTITPSTGTYTDEQSVTISTATSGASIYYTTDGTTPTPENGTLYSGAFTVSETTTVKAIAIAAGYDDSNVTTSEINISSGSSSTSTIYRKVTSTDDFVPGHKYILVYENGSSAIGMGAISGSKGTPITGLTIDNNTIDISDKEVVVFTLGGTTNAYTLQFPDESNYLLGASNTNLSANTLGNTAYWTATKYSDGYYFVNNENSSRGVLYSTQNEVFGHYAISNLTGTNAANYSPAYLYVQDNASSLKATPNPLTITDATTGHLNVSASNLSGNITPSFTGSNNEGWSFNPTSLPATGGDLAVNYTTRFLEAQNTIKLSANDVDDVEVPVKYRPDLYIVGNYSDGNGWDFTTGTPMVYDENTNTYSATITTTGATYLKFTKKLGDNGWSEQQFWDNNYTYLYGPNSGGNWEVNEGVLGGTHSLNLTNGVHECIEIPAYLAGTFTITVMPPYSFSITRQMETVATPTFSPAGGTYNGAQEVTISCATDGATIYYSTDGGNTWTPGNSLTVRETTTVMAKATKNGMTDSETASATYTIRLLDGTQFELVTSTDDVDDSGEYVLVYPSGSGNNYAMAAFNSNHYYATATTGFELDNNIVILDENSTVNVLTLEEAGEGLFNIVDHEGYYLYYSDSGNSVDHNASLGSTNNYKWSISINESGDVVIVNHQYTSRYLRCNYSASRYACYDGSQVNAKLYKRGSQTPKLKVTPTQVTLDPIPVGSSESEAKAFTVSGTNLPGNVTISTDNANFIVTVDEITPVNGTVEGTVVGVKYIGTSTTSEGCTVTVTCGNLSKTVTVYGGKKAVPVAPTISPATGTYYGDLAVTISSDEDVTYIYTTDGSEPSLTNGTTGSSLTATYDAGGTTTIKAIAVDGENVSAVTEVTYIWGIPTVTISPDSRNVTAASVHVTMSATPNGAVIYYTTDGSEPTTSSAQYSSTFDVDLPNIGDEVTVKAISVINGVTSDEASATYTRVEKVIDVNAPFFSPLQNQTYYGTQTLQMGCTTPNADIYYIIEEYDFEGNPTKSSTYYEGQTINMTPGHTYYVKAIAYIGNNVSPVNEGTYTILNEKEDTYSVTYVKNCAEFNALPEGTTGTISFMNPVQVVYMSTYENRGERAEFCYIRDNSDYACVYFGKNNPTYHTLFSMGDWIDGNQIRGTVNIWENNFHNQLGSSSHSAVSSWPTARLGWSEIIPETTDCYTIASGTKDGENQWGHYVHVPYTTIEGVHEYKPSSDDYKNIGTIRDASGVDTYYDKFYLWSNTYYYNSVANYNQIFFDSKQNAGATFAVYGIVDYYNDNKSPEETTTPYPFEVCPIDFLWVYQPTITVTPGNQVAGQTDTYAEPQTVTIEAAYPEWAAHQVVIYYKTDEMDDWAVYEGPITVSANTTIQTYAEVDAEKTDGTNYNDMVRSMTVSQDFYFEGIEDPIITDELDAPAADTYEDRVIEIGTVDVPVPVTILTNENSGEGTVTYYTVDGSDPRTSETRIELTSETAVVDVDKTTTIMAISCLEVDENTTLWSNTVTRTYTFVKKNGVIFDLVTQAPVVGNVYVIVHKDAYMGMSTTQNENNRGGVGVMFTDDSKQHVYGNDELAQFVLESANAGRYYFKNINGDNTGYLVVTTNAVANLNTTGDATAYAQAGVTIGAQADGSPATIVFSYDGTNRYLRYYENGRTFSTYTDGTLNKEVYLYGVQATPLAYIESSSKVNDQVTVSDQLIGVWAVNNGTVKYLWAKDQGQVSIDKRPAIDPKTEDNPDGQADYMVTHMKYQHYDFEGGYDWDESNWVILDFSTTSDDPFEYVGYKLQSMSVIGTYSDDNNYTIALDRGELPIKVSETQDAAEYPGWAGDDRGQHDSDNYGKKYRWAYNTYMPANFMPENLNREVDGQVVGFVSDNTALPNMQNQKLYFMNPKIMEVAHIWGVWCGNGSDKFSIYQVGMENGETVNAWNLHGAIDVLSWDYNHKEGSYGKPIGLDETAQDFHAVIVRKPGSKSLKAGVNNDPSSDEYGIYPLDMPDGGQPTAVRDLNADRQVESVRYYNVMGVESRQPFQGVNIIVTRFTDGTTTAVKVNK